MIDMILVLHLIEGILLLAEVVSDPVLEYKGTQLTNNESTILQFSCSTINVFLGCTVEFLVNRRTYDDIRSRNNTCHHKDGICQPDRCECYEDCKAFTWNFTAKSENVNSTFGCGSRIQENGKTYKGNTSLQWTGSDFITLQKTFILINVEITTTGFPSGITESNPSSTVYVVGGLVSLTISVILIISMAAYIFWLRKRRKDETTHTGMKQLKTKSRPLSLSELAQHRQDRNDENVVNNEYELHEPQSRDSDDYTNIRDGSKQVCTVEQNCNGSIKLQWDYSGGRSESPQMGLSVVESVPQNRVAVRDREGNGDSRVSVEVRAEIESEQFSNFDEEAIQSGGIDRY
ncbi:unnamed protein product [Mytilus coruscus]|uniref:Uncharacterized protein n=1 Tax=Mytilus coruscus TaxID=42192 RepID=A0A6J8E5E7_MYTCO|nr:unnamed protein product [Mytilus coruscus]